MGTTQRIGNGPNWGSISTAVTSIANTINNLNDLENDTKSNDKINDISKREKKLEKRKDKHIKSVLERLIKISGGSKAISSGKSNTIGRAGIKASNKMAGFFYSVSSKGLKEALNEIGFSDIEEKKVSDILSFLLDYFSDETIGMDEAAAKSAIYEVIKELESEVDGEIDSLESLMKSYVESTKLSEILCTFFGKYIYEFLWERFEERLRQKKGEDVTRETFISIQNEIKSRVILLNSNRELSKINWSAAEGRIEIEKIFEAIIKIEE
jgi:hypothetical protein